MVEIFVLFKSLQGKFPIHLVQAPEQRPHKLHAANMAEQLRDSGIAGRITGSHGDVIVGGLELDILRSKEVIGVAEDPGTLCGERGVELLDGFEEDKLLVSRK